MLASLLTVVALGVSCTDGQDAGDPLDPVDPVDPCEADANIPQDPGERSQPVAADLTPAGPRSYSDTISVTDFGARGDGVTDDTDAIQDAINAASAGTAVFFPRTDAAYVVNSGINLKSDVGLISDGATIDSRDYEGTVFMVQDVDRVEFAGLNFLGTRTANTYSRAIHIRNSTGNLIRDSEFTYFYGGAVVITGDENTVRNSTFVEVNNSPPESGAHYGSIHVIDGHQNVIVDNEIIDFDYSGISLYNANYNLVARNIVRARDGFPPNSMGIYLLGGASYNVVEENVVSGAAAECIAIVSNSHFGPVAENVIRNNDVADCDYVGISLETNGSYPVQNNYVEDNLIQGLHMGSGDVDHGIIIVGAIGNTVVGNRIRSDGSMMGRGIYMQESPSNNVIEYNEIEGMRVKGIHAAGDDSRWLGNRIRAVPRGIDVSNAPNAVIRGNLVRETGESSISIGSNTGGTQVYENRTDRDIQISGSGVEAWGNTLLSCP